MSLFTREPRAPDVVRHVSLELINGAIQNQNLSDENTTSAKISLLGYVQQTYAGVSASPDSGNIQNKLAQTITLLFTALYSSRWQSFFEDLRGLGVSEVQSGAEGLVGTSFYLRVLASVHDEIADQMIQTTPERSKLHMELKDLIRARDAQTIASSWQDILSRWQRIDQSVLELCLSVMSRWVSWTDISLVANEGVLQHLFQIACQGDTGHPESGASKARSSAIGVFTELVAKKMKSADKIDLLRFLNVDAIVSRLIGASILQNTASPDYDTDMAETVARLVNNVVLEVVNALNTSELGDSTRAAADSLLQSFTPYLLRFLADEYDEVCSTIMPALTEQLIFFRKDAKSSGQLRSPYKEMLPPILDALIAKMRYDDTSSWGEEDEETDEAEFQELRKRLKVAQQNVAVIDESLYSETLSRVVESTFRRYQREGTSFNWRDLDVALVEMYMLGELAVRNSGSYQKKSPSTSGSQRLVDTMSLMMDCNVSSFDHPTAQLQVMEIWIRYYSFFDQHTQYLPKILEDFVRFVHSNNTKVRHRAWHYFLRFARTLRMKLGDLAETIIGAVGDLLLIRAELPTLDDGDESSSSSAQGPRDPTFQSQLFLFEAIGSLASIPSLSTEKQVALLQPVLSPLLEGMKQHVDSALGGDERALLQTHHYIEASGVLARGFSDWVPGKSTSPVPQQVSAEFKKASEMILKILGALKSSLTIREASRFGFTRLVGVLGFTLLEQLPLWIDGLLSGNSTREEIANFLRLLAQLVYGFKTQIYDTLNQLLSPLLDRIFAALSQPAQGTDDILQLGELRREYLNFLNVVLSNRLEGTLVSPANQSKFDTIITSMEHFSRDTDDLSDARLAIGVLNRMAEVWGGPNVFSPSPANNVAQASVPAPSLPGFDRFLISRFSAVTWTVMTNPGFHPRDAAAAKVVQEIATLQQTILSKTGAIYAASLQEKELPGIGLGGQVVVEYLQSITTKDNKAFRQWLTTFLQQGPGG